ncbi:hypothetical protein FXN65_16415 [Metapseudomonas lalkuanensis]|uniref:Uncharacterized protein n=1 Tax=Metapseudomonas lalkuanensis TaxID=2604832 RepID=A0A5J6QS79_9GAMM|nr:hypothetical protein [Pseudomonas lalkuanensis]QEY63566.1 hypothetical protein FXN65_16415 [Pseudomonas lalkuanensis]
MPNYTRIAYIIVGTKSYHQWEDFASKIIEKALMTSGKARVIDADQEADVSWLSELSDSSNQKMITILRVEMEDVLAGKSMHNLHFYLMSTHNHGAPGKIIVLGHGSLGAEIGAYADKDKKVYLASSQKTFIEAVFPTLPPHPSTSLNLPPDQGLKTIALRQCYAARTTSKYVSKSAQNNSYEAAAGSAADITAKALRKKGWSGLGITLTSSPEFNIFFGGTASVEMSTIMPLVNQVKGNPTVLPAEHKVSQDGSRIEIAKGAFADKSQLKTHDSHQWWTPDGSNQVLYPDHWIVKKNLFSWEILLPEYVRANVTANSLTPIATSESESMHLKKTEFKVRTII